MTRNDVDQLLKIDSEAAARQFAEDSIERYRKDPEFQNCSAREIFESDLRWCFGEDNLDEPMPFAKVALWAKVVTDL